MARIRYIKPQFFEDTDIAELSPWTRLLYIGLWCFMDRQGVFEDNPKLIKRNIFPYDNLSSDDVSGFVRELVNGGYLIPVEFEGKKLLWCPTFEKNQKLHPGEKPSWRIPTHLLATSQQPPCNLNDSGGSMVKCAGIGIGIGTGTGTGIGIGTGIGTGTGTAPDALNREPFSELSVEEANAKLIQMRRSLPAMPGTPGGGAA